MYKSWWANNILGFLLDTVRAFPIRTDAGATPPCGGAESESGLIAMANKQFVLAPFFAWKVSHNAHHVRAALSRHASVPARVLA